MNMDFLTLKQGVCTLPASLDCLKSGLSIIWVASPLSLFNFLCYILPGLSQIRKTKVRIGLSSADFVSRLCPDGIGMESAECPRLRLPSRQAATRFFRLFT
jgi:hypothetical protein